MGRPASSRGRGGGARGRAAGGQAALCPQDALQEEYSRTGTFPGTPMVPPRRPWTLVNWLFWASLLLYPFFRFLVNVVRSGSSLTLASFVLVFFVGEYGASGAWAGAGGASRKGQGGAGGTAPSVRTRPGCRSRRWTGRSSSRAQKPQPGGLPPGRPLPVRMHPLRLQAPPGTLISKKTISWVLAGANQGSLLFKVGPGLFGEVSVGTSPRLPPALGGDVG